MRSLTVAASLALAATVALAGCGGNPKSPSVASLGSPATTTAGGNGGTADGGGSPSTGSGPGGGVGGLTMKMQDGAKFSACMRAHGVRNFPDPGAQGAIQIGPGSGIDPSSHTFQAAQAACRKLLPNGGQPTPQQMAAMQRQALAFSACMRSHGLPDFPDPTFRGNHISIAIRGGPGSDLDPRSPAFQAAQKACRGKLPGKIAAGAAGTK